MKVLSAAWLALVAVLVVVVVVLAWEAADGDRERGSARDEARVEEGVEAKDAGSGEREDAEMVERGDAPVVPVDDASVRCRPVRAEDGAVEMADLRPTAADLAYGSGTADEPRGRMVVSVCCHCCKLCSCLAVSSAIASINANMSQFRDRDDVGRKNWTDVDDREEDEDEEGRERLVVRVGGVVVEMVMSVVG